MARAGSCVDVRRRLLGDVRTAARRVLLGPEGRGRSVKRAFVTLSTLALLLPANAFARGSFDPTTEFEQKEWIPIHLGPLNLSITKAVAYLMLGTALTILLGLFLMRARLALLPDRRQTVGEALYEVAQVQVAEQGLPSKAIGRWF